MTTVDFVTELCCWLDDVLTDVPKHSPALLYPSEVVTIACLFASKGVGNRAFYRRLVKDSQVLFPKLPDRTRLLRLFKSHRGLTARFLAEPRILGVMDTTYGLELMHPIPRGRERRPDWAQRPREASLDRGRQVVLAAEPSRPRGGLGLRHGQGGR